VTPHETGKAPVVLGPGMRVDLVIDCAGAPESRFAIADNDSRAVAIRHSRSKHLVEFAAICQNEHEKAVTIP
jgi:hypothetical protein